jgi:hypothetical protein
MDIKPTHVDKLVCVVYYALASEMFYCTVPLDVS